MSRTAIALAVTTTFAAGLLLPVVHAQEGAPAASAAAPASSPSTAAPTEGDLELAKQLYREGNELRKTGDYQGALERYQKSRRLVPSIGNTINSAYCLQRLGRHDEALDTYEELLAAFTLPAGEKAAVDLEIEGLRKKVGFLSVTVNVESKLLVDGRVRGVVPSKTPFRINAGKRVVRVIRDGYEAFERTVDVATGATSTVDARLSPLAAAGKLRVDTTNLVGATLFIDGSPVGVLPYDGALAPGAHVLFAIDYDRGSDPLAVDITEGSTKTLVLDGGALGHEHQYSVVPPTAELLIDGVALGRGVWRGRLTHGKHTLAATEVGYLEGRLEISVSEGSQDETLTLRPDESHPRWPKTPAGHVVVGLFGALTNVSSIAADAALCGGARCDEGFPILTRLGGAVAWEWPSGLSLGVQVGLLSFSRSLSRGFDGVLSSGTPVTWSQHEEVGVTGPFFGPAAAYRWVLGGRWELTMGAASGAYRVSARYSASPGSVRAADGELRTTTMDPRQVSGWAAWIAPEFGLGVRIGRVLTTLSLVGLFVSRGPVLSHGDPRVDGASRDRCAAQPAALDCAAGAQLGEGDRAFSPFVAGMPQLTVALTL